jgi:hypothetical protein
MHRSGGHLTEVPSQASERMLTNNQPKELEVESRVRKFKVTTSQQILRLALASFAAILLSGITAKDNATPFNGEHKAGPLAMISVPNAETGLGPLCTDPSQSTIPTRCNP